jgi:putative ABC transport system permease protein
LRGTRTALTASGIAFGVALVFGVLVSVASVSREARALSAGAAGGADAVVLPLGANGSALAADVTESLRRIRGTTAIVDLVSFPTSVTADSRRNVGVDEAGATYAPLLIGIERADVDALYRYRLASGRLFSDGSDEVVLPTSLADRLAVEVEDAVEVSTPTGRWSAIVVGVIDDSGAGAVNGGLTVFSSITTARRVAALEADASTLMAVKLAPDVSVRGWLAAARPDLPPGVELVDSSGGIDSFRQGIDTLGDAFVAFSALALFIASFLVFLTLTVSVAERTVMYGTLRALGIRRSQLALLVVREALVLGAVSSVLGVLLGSAVALALLRVVSALFHVPPIQPAFRPVTMLAAIGLGVAATVVGAAVPARRAAQVDPSVAFRGGLRVDRTTVGRAAVVAFLATLAALCATRSSLAASTAAAVLVLATLVAGLPLVMPYLVGAVRLVTRRSVGLVGMMSLSHLAHERKRSGYTVALVASVLAMVIAIGVVYSSMRATFDRQVDAQFGADLQLTATTTFGPEFVPELMRVRGVRGVSTTSDGSTRVSGSGQRVDLTSIDPETYFAVSGFPWAEGDAASAWQALRRGGAVIVPAAFAEKQGWEVGDSVTLDSPTGPRPFDIVATFDASLFFTQQRLYLSATDALAVFGADRPSTVLVDVDGTDVSGTRRRMEEALRDHPPFLVESAATVKADLAAQFNGFFTPSYVVLVVAVVVGGLGVANTLAVSVLERSREIAVLRAVGARQRYVQRLVFAESSLLTTCGVILALPAGWILSELVLGALEASISVSTGNRPAWGWLAAALASSLLIGGAASVAPARRVTRTDVVSALRPE